LGLESFASDLNPVAVLINKAMIEIPPKFAGKPPVNPTAQTITFPPKATQAASSSSKPPSPLPVRAASAATGGRPSCPACR